MFFNKNTVAAFSRRFLWDLYFFEKYSKNTPGSIFAVFWGELALTGSIVGVCFLASISIPRTMFLEYFLVFPIFTECSKYLLYKPRLSKIIASAIYLVGFALPMQLWCKGRRGKAWISCAYKSIIQRKNARAAFCVSVC